MLINQQQENQRKGISEEITTRKSRKNCSKRNKKQQQKKQKQMKIKEKGIEEVKKQKENLKRVKSMKT